jgi:phosphoenolpyruvate synthase/pyruvate phosphate dikinase
MFGTSKSYILNTHTLTDLDHPKVGDEATELAKLAQAGVIVPDSLVLTTEAFDDFITAADIAERINSALTSVDAEQPTTAQHASDIISGLIMQASFPSLILNPLIQAYKGLSGFSEKYVKVEASWVLPIQLEPSEKAKYVRLNVKGEPALLYAIKQCWASLFSAEALLKRAAPNYQGDLSIAVIVQKMVQAEISGKAFSYDPITTDNVIYIEAILGLDTTEAKTIVPDVYKVDPIDMRTREKNIVSQDYMYLRKGRAKPEEDPNMKINISAEWRRGQKLPDHSITELAQIVHKLAEHYGHPVETHWAYETGQLNILGAHELKALRQPKMDMQVEVNRALSLEPQLEVLSVTPSMPAEKLPINIKSLAVEVQNMVNDKEVAVEEVEAEPITLDVPVVADAKFKDTKESIGLITQTYLDISDMSSDKLAHAGSFDGVYLDGTHTVLRHKVLAEDIGKDTQKLSNLIESYALEIATAAKVIEPKPIYYSFSDIGNQERAKLQDGTSAVEGINGSDRFIQDPAAMVAEILAIKRARSTYDAKNIKLILPRLRSQQELADIKKILSGQNVRRSSIVQLFAEISTPGFIYELEHVEARELDGILVNLPKLARTMSARHDVSRRDYATAINAIQHMITQNANKKFTSIVLVPTTEEVIELAMPLHAGGLVFSEIPSTPLLKLVKSLEEIKLQSAPVRRGRKIKSL